jgi:hypothetical protein
VKTAPALAWVAVWAGLLGAAAGAHARDSRSRVAPPPFTVAAVPASVPQGGVLVVLARPLGSGAVQDLTARLGGRTAAGFPWAGEELRALLPVPADATPGPATVALRVKDGDGDEHDVLLPFTVVRGDFETDELSVGSRFVSPTRKQLAQARADSRAFEAAWRKGSPERLWRGSFKVPVPPRVTATFGTFRTLNGKVRSRHMGTDYGARVGDPILAANNGRVVLARNCFYAGNAVVLDHGGGLFTTYYHLTTFRVRDGETVRRGQVLGTAGATGRVTGPHLHLGVKLLGTYVDPVRFLGMDFSEDPLASQRRAGSRPKPDPRSRGREGSPGNGH